MESVYEYRTLLACDIASSAGRGEATLQEIRGVLASVWHAAFQAAGLDWSRCRRQDTGDGFQLAAPAGVRKATLLYPMLPYLGTLVRQHNRQAPDETRIRLRIALHAGEVRLDQDGGLSGAPFEILARLLNAAPLRAALTEAPESVPVAAILSHHYGEETVGHGPDGPDADAFVPVEVREKEYAARAWLHYPGCPIGPRVAPLPAPATASSAPEERAVQKNTATGHGEVFAVQNGSLHVRGRKGGV